MAIQEFTKTVYVFPIIEAIVPVFMAGYVIFLAHKSVRIFAHLLANFRLLLQKRLQRGMLVHKFPVVYERGILADLLGYFPMAFRELVEACQFTPASRVVVTSEARGIFIKWCAVVTRAFLTIIAIFLPQKRVRIFSYLLPKTLVLIQIGLQRGMFLYEFLVVDQRWIFTKLLADFAVGIQKLIKLSDVPSGGVVVLIARV